MNIKKHKIYVLIYVLGAVCVFYMNAAAQNVAPKRSSKILFVPLDDRPPCFQWVVRMGEIGDAEIVAPPREMLGRFTESGKSDEIAAWLKKQNLKSFDAAIVSVDMLAYGGLVAMREYKTDEKTAMNRLNFLRELKRAAPRMKIYASSVIMRLAPTGNVVNESYRENLSKWAEISVDADLRKETAELQRKIPAEALADYRAARARDLKINLAAVDLVKDKVLEQLILGQDDAKPKGVHVADRERLIAEVKNLDLQSKIGVQPGADELSMLQLARSLSDKYAFQPKIKVVYSSEAIRNQIMPYEDRPLHQTVSFQIEAVGAREVAAEADADILFYVYASRFETGRAESFAEEIENNFAETSDGVSLPKRNAKKVIIADVDPKGDVQGADAKFTEALKSSMIFPKILGYAAWNTAGNTIGTALPHGMLFGLSKSRFAFRPNEKLTRPEIDRRNVSIRRAATAQTWFMLNRLLDDYVYHSLVRPEAMKYARGKGWNVFRFDAEQTKSVEGFSAPKVRRAVSESLNRLSPLTQSAGSNLVCENVENFSFILPWGRTFEAEIDFKLVCKDLSQPVKGKNVMGGGYDY